MDSTTGALESPAPAPVAAPAAPAPEPGSQVVKADGSSVDSLLEQIRAADKSATESVTPESSPEPESKAAEESAPAETPEEKTVEPAKAEGEQAKEAAPDQTADSIRTLIKKSNLPPERKDELAALVYKGLQFSKLGFDFEQAKFLKEVGVEPNVIVDRLKLHPTLKDAQADAEYAADMRELIGDLTTQPAVAARKLHATSPETFRPMAEDIIDHGDTIAPEKMAQVRSDGFRAAMIRIAKGAERSSNADLQAAAAMVLDHVFGGEQDPGLDPNNPVVRENQRLKAMFEQQQQQRTRGVEQARAQFGTALQSVGAQAIFNDIKAAVEGRKPTGMDADLIERTAGDAFNGVTENLLANQSFMREMERFTAGAPTQEQLAAAIEFARSRAKALLPLYLGPAFEKWGKYAVQKAEQRQATQAKTAAKPDVGRAAGPPTPSAGVPDHEVVLAEGKSLGLTNLEMIQRHSARLAARQR